jgi:hypothetical protein
MFARASSQCGVAGRQEDEMIQIRARETERAFVSDERNPGLRTEIFMTLIAG